MFNVFSSEAALSLEGDGGANQFNIRAFALAETDATGDIIFPGNCDPNTTVSCLPTPLDPPVSGGSGGSTFQIAYAMDAPIVINGGSGGLGCGGCGAANQLTVIGTEYADHFVLSGDGIYGAGLSVTYSDVASIELNTHEGGDTVDVLSTVPGVSVGIIGGQWDQVNVDCGCSGGSGGTINGNVYAVDASGTSAVINQSVLTYAQWCEDLTIPGVSLSVAQATAGPVLITEPAAGLSVTESGTGPIGTIASYDVSLAQQPNCGSASSCTVYVTVTAEPGTLLQRSGTPASDSVLLAVGANPSPGTTTANSAFYQHVVINGVAVDIPQRTIVLVFTSSNWATPQVVSVGAMNTPAASATEIDELSTSVQATDPVFDNAVVSDVAVTKVGTGAPGITVINLGSTDTPGVYADGVGNGTTTFSSASASFTAADVGQAIIEIDGRGLIPTGTTILTVVNATTVTLSAVVAKGTAIAFALPSRVTASVLTSYRDGAATAGSTTFTSASAAFNAGDVGRPIVETDGGTVIAPNSVILTVVNSTTVTLSSAAKASATGVGFALPARNASDVVLAGTATTAIVDYASVTLASKPTGTVILDVNPGYLVTLSSTDSRFVALSAPCGQQPGVYQITFTSANWNIPVVIAVTATGQSGPGDQSQESLISFSVDKKSTAPEYIGVNTNCAPLIIQVANAGTGAIVQPSSGLTVVKCGNAACTLPGAGASYTLRLTEAPPSGQPLTVAIVPDGQTTIMPGGAVSYAAVTGASFSGTATYNATAGTLTLAASTCSNPNWMSYGFAVGQLFQINGTGPLYKIQALTATVLTVTTATLNVLTGAETVTPLPFTGTGSAKVTLKQWAAVVTFTCNNWWVPVTVRVVADPYFTDPSTSAHELTFPSGPQQLTGACPTVTLQPGQPLRSGVPTLAVMLPLEKNAEPFGYPDIPPTPTITITPASVTGTCSGSCSNEYITDIDTPQFVTADADPAATLHIYVNGVLYTGQALANGVYCVTVVATNNFGFTATGTLAEQLVIDTSPPSGSFTVQGGKTINGELSTNTTTPTLLLSFCAAVSGVGLATVAVSINGGAFSAAQTYTSSLRVALTSGDGIYTIAIRVTDCAGNVVTDTQTIRLDTTGPAITASLSAPQQTIGYDGTANITLTDSATDVSGVASLRATLDGVALSSSTINVETLTAGVHTIVATAADGLGNTSTVTLTLTLHPSLTGIEDAVKAGYSAGSISAASEETTLLGGSDEHRLLGQDRSHELHQRIDERLHGQEADRHRCRGRTADELGPGPVRPLLRAPEARPKAQGRVESLRWDGPVGLPGFLPFSGE